MRNIFLISLLALALVGCASDQVAPVVTINKPVVLVPPKQYLNCPLTTLPKSFTTNKEVAQLLVQTWHDENTCHVNMQAIQNYLNQAQSTIK